MDFLILNEGGMPLLSVLIFLPLAGALIALFLPGEALRCLDCGSSSSRYHAAQSTRLMSHCLAMSQPPHKSSQTDSLNAACAAGCRLLKRYASL